MNSPRRHVIEARQLALHGFQVAESDYKITNNSYLLGAGPLYLLDPNSASSEFAKSLAA